jgi:hypothetical protein
VFCAATLWGADPAPAQPADLQDFLNLPSWVKLSAEYRGRAESTGRIALAPGAEDDAYYLERIRVNANLRVTPWLHTFVQVQDSRVFDYDKRPLPATMNDPLDLRQAYVEAGSLDEGSWGARFGRQPLIFGDMRLVSTSNWGNVGPDYDGVRITHRIGKIRLDGFATMVVQPTTGFDYPRSGKRLGGLYGVFPGWIPGGTVEGYWFLKENLWATDAQGRTGHLDVHTYGSHVFGKLPRGFEYNLEMALQRGHEAAMPMEAWAGHWEASHPLPLVQAPVRLIAEYNYATGDKNAGDNVRQTFDNLYPTDKWGTADGIGWRNIHEPILNAEWKPNKKWKVKVAEHWFWLASRQDGLYSIAGVVLARNPQAASSEVGREFDVRASYKQSAHWQWMAGYGRFTAGPFLEESGKGDAVNYPYLMGTWTF